MAESREEVSKDEGELVETIERQRRGTGGGFGQCKQGDGSDEDRPDQVTGSLRFGGEGEKLLRVGGEGRGISELGDEVVVVRVEPFRHLQRSALRCSASESEVVLEAAGRVRVGAVTRGRGDESDGQGCVEDMIVVAVGGGDRVVLAQSQLGQAVVGVDAQGVHGSGEIRDIDAAGPIGFQGLLLFAAGADAWVAGDGGGREWGGHAWFSFVVA